MRSSPALAATASSHTGATAVHSWQKREMACTIQTDSGSSRTVGVGEGRETETHRDMKM